MKRRREEGHERRREPGAAVGRTRSAVVNLAAEKARAAARCRELAERLTQADRDDLIRAWTRTLDEADAARSDGAAERVLTDFREAAEHPPCRRPSTGPG